MIHRDPDIVVIGSGPNGLVAAASLAREGLSVLVLEANPRRPGGAVGSAALTLPGFLHDVGAGFFPFAAKSRAFAELGLSRAGVEWLRAPIDSCHPAEDGSVACLSRDLGFVRQHFGSSADGEACAQYLRFFQRVEPHLLAALLGPCPTLGPLFRLGAVDLLRLVRSFARTGRGLASSLFQTPAARRVFPGLGLHADLSPTDALSAGLGAILGGLAHTSGFVVPRGGAQGVTNALIAALERHGGTLRLGAKVSRIELRKGRACAVKLADGEEIAAKIGVFADVAAPTLFLDLLPADQVSWWVKRKMRRFPYGFGLVKLDWALSARVPWKAEEARSSAVVHLGASVEELTEFVAELRRDQAPVSPYLLVGQQSLVDPTRAPEGCHTLYAYTHLPASLARDPRSPRNAYLDRLEQRIERLAPGFRASILGRHVTWPEDFVASNPSLLHGSHLGGSAQWYQQLFFRPVFPHFRYRLPIQRLFLCSSYAHPGGGVHGMCGYNAAGRLLQELG